MLSLRALVFFVPAGCDSPGRSRRERAQMEEGFRQSLVLGERGGVIALLLHSELLQRQIGQSVKKRREDRVEK